MTTFQDPQPQSRRAVRQSERGDGPESVFPSQPPAGPVETPQYFDPDTQRDMWDTNARRAAQLPPTPAPRADSAVTGRRAAPNASQPPAAAEPLNYSTASRQPSAPGYDPQSFRSRLDARQAGQQPPAAPANLAADQNYRVRDFSPEGRRAAQAAERAATTPAWTPTTPPTDLDYQTEVREGFGMPMAPPSPAAPPSAVPPQFAAPQAYVAPQPAAPPVAAPAPQAYVAPQPVVAPAPYPTAAAAAPQPTAPSSDAPYSDTPGEQTLSRRELRALLAQEEAAKAGIPFDPTGEATHNAPVSWQAPQPVAPPLVQRTPFAAPVPQQAPVAPAPIGYSAPQQAPAAQQAPAPQQAPAYEATRLPEAARAGLPPEPAANAAMTNALAEFDSLSAAPALQEPEAKRVRNHWTAQDAVEDDVESTINRRVGSGSTATNALVLPEIPGGADIRGPLTSTGEVMLTGSIDLPRSLSSTGTTSRIDHDGIDGLFDLNDHEVISTDSQPVRAVKAVSTHQTGHGVTHTQKPKGTRALTVLLISASSMAVVVAGLLVAAFAFNIF